MKMGLWWGMAQSTYGGSLESGGQFCVGEFGRHLASVTMKKSLHLIYFIKKCYKYFIAMLFAKTMLQ
jgi:hypothetical protein